MGMKRMLAAGILLLMTMASACSAEQTAVLTGIVFDRGHGSAWGNQFYIEVSADVVNEVRYIPEGAMDQETCTDIPITPQQWEAICEAVQALELQEDRPKLWQKLWESQKLDGGEYRSLTLRWRTEKGVKEIRYLWPEGEKARALEALLEELVRSS